MAMSRKPRRELVVMVEDVVHRVAVATLLSRLPKRESHVKPRAHHGARQRWWHIRESVVDGDSDVLRQLSRRKIDVEDEVKAARGDTCTGFARPENTSRMKAHTDVINTRRAR